MAAAIDQTEQPKIRRDKQTGNWLCPYCEYESIHTCQRVKNHVQTMHTWSERGYKCSEDHCSETFATKWDREWHLNDHYAYKCEHCGQAYKTSGGLMNHELNRIENDNQCLNNSNRVKPWRKAIPNPEIQIAVETDEETLEDMIKKFKQDWQSYKVQLNDYKEKFKLVGGWDDLLNKVKRHMNSLSSKKPYYQKKVVEKKALEWEIKLKNIEDFSEVWNDVQHRWMYLEGIFGRSGEIKALLPNETADFKSINSKFLTWMADVAKSPMISKVLNILTIKRSRRLAERLEKLENALEEFLERQRASFARFHFVDSKELLEIIDNGNNIPVLTKHFEKMFTGVSSILMNEQNDIILGIASREGEKVFFNTPVSTKEYPTLNEWLTQVEKEIRDTLAHNLADSVRDIRKFKEGIIDKEAFLSWCNEYEAQNVVLAAQIMWSEDVEAALQAVSTTDDKSLAPVQRVLNQVDSTIHFLTNSLPKELPHILRCKLDRLMDEFVRQQTVTLQLIRSQVTQPKAAEWLCQMRFSFDPKQTDSLKKLYIYVAKKQFQYGFEYLGVQDRQFHTTMTDRCYQFLTQALESRLGSSLIGTDETDKIEFIKALGHQLGRFVYVFNCDETFDIQAMDRIFVGLCQAGAWICFDEFNRLEEGMLSAVSEKLQTIQGALNLQKEKKKEGSLVIELNESHVRVSENSALFITMNPGYAGRSNLPDNLQKHFRSLDISHVSLDMSHVSLDMPIVATPDRQIIVVTPSVNAGAGLSALQQSPVNSKRGRLFSTYTSSPVEDYQNLIDSDEETENPAVKKSADSACYTLGLETDLSPTSRHLYEKTAPQSTESNLDRRDQLTWDDEMFPMQHMREETDADDELMRFKLDQSKLQQQVDELKEKCCSLQQSNEQLSNSLLQKEREVAKLNQSNTQMIVKMTQLQESNNRLEQEKLLATIEKGAGFHAVTQQIQQIQEEWIEGEISRHLEFKMKLQEQLSNLFK